MLTEAQICHSRVGGNPFDINYTLWIPAFAGMTATI